VSCCSESGEILILPREGGYRDLSEDPSSALTGDVISSLESQVEFGQLGGELFEGLSRLRSWPFVLEVPESEVEDRLLDLSHRPPVPVGASAAHVAVVDSGVDPSAVCCGRLSVEQLNVANVEQPIRSPPHDGDGHGSTVASIIHVIDPWASITSIRCFEQGRAALSDIINGILLGLLLLEPIDVFNLSLRIDASTEVCPNCEFAVFGPSAERAMRRVFDHLRFTAAPEPVFIAAAGNHGPRVAVPAALEGIVAVGSTGASAPADPRPEPSYRDLPPLFVVAPGGSRDDPVGWTGAMNQRQRFGTSFATAVVSGASARLVSAGWDLRAEPPGAKGALLLSRLEPWLWRGFPGYERAVHGAGVLRGP
jgi:hypothetical protein